MLPIANKTSACVMKAIKQLQETYSEHFGEGSKTITTDNGSNSPIFSELEKMADTLVYYAHPHTSCDKGTVERHNGLIRRFIPKGKRIDDFTASRSPMWRPGVTVSHGKSWVTEPRMKSSREIDHLPGYYQRRVSNLLLQFRSRIFLQTVQKQPGKGGLRPHLPKNGE